MATPAAPDDPSTSATPAFQSNPGGGPDEPRLQPTLPGVSAPAQSKRRLELAVFGLAIALVGVLIELVAIAALANPPLDQDAVAGLVLFMLLGAVPVALGLSMAHRGDPGIGRRFLRDIRTNLAQLRQPSNLAAALTTSFGLAFAIGAVTLVLMFIDRRRAPITAMFGLTVFSAVDPILVLTRNSWWLGAAMSAGTWMMLLLVLVITAQAMQPMGEGSLIFLLPMMVFGGVLALSALIRLVMYLGTPKNEQSS